MATGFSVGHLPESSVVTPGGQDTDKVGNNSSKSTSLQTERIPKGHPKDTLGIAQRYPKDTRRTPGGYPKDTPIELEGHPKDTPIVLEGHPKDTPIVPQGYPKDTTQGRPEARCRPKDKFKGCSPRVIKLGSQASWLGNSEEQQTAASRVPL